MADQEILYIVKADNKQAIDAFNKLKASMDGVTTKTKNLADKTQNSNMLLMSTGRIVQDMPYGFMAVGNNITFMAEQMGYMRSQGMSTKEMLLGMVTALKGPMGVIFAISTATSLLTMFTRNTGSAKEQTKNLTEALKSQWDATYKSRKEWEKFSEDLGKFSTSDLIESLNTVNRQRQELTISATTMILATLGFYGGLAEVYGELAKLQKEAGLIGEKLFGPKILGWEDVPKKMQDKWKDSFKTKDPQGLAGQKQVLEMLDDQLEKTRQRYIKFYETVRQINDGTYFNGKLGMKGVNQPNKPGLGFSDNEIRQDFIEENAFFLDMTLSSLDVLKGEFSQMWVNMFGEANSLFEKMIMNWVSIIGSNALNSLFGSLLNFVVPGLGSAVGLADSRTSGGGSVINLQMDKQTMATWYVGGKQQASRLRMD